jgi:hypothetical protein
MIVIRPNRKSFGGAAQQIHDSFAYSFLREKNALNAATASLERMRSPNKWPS